MATTTPRTPDPLPQPQQTPSPARGYFLGTIDRFVKYIQCFHAQNQLQSMDDRLLADIGVNRGDIPNVVWGDGNACELPQKPKPTKN